MSRFDLVLSRISRVIGLAVGTGILVYETIWDRQDRPWLYAAAIGAMGLPMARAAESILGKIAGTSNTPAETPEKRPPAAREDAE